MASIREAINDIYYDAKDGIAWIVVWKTGRSWNMKAFYLSYNERKHVFDQCELADLEEMKQILSADPEAIIVNPYYQNCAPFEEMTKKTLEEGLRWQYEDARSIELREAVEDMEIANRQSCKTREKFIPQSGKTYINEAGGKYKCLESFESCNAWMQNVSSGWTFIAHGCGIYRNKTIDWDYSTDGHFVDRKEAVM